MEPEQVDNPLAYVLLLVAQTAAASVLFWMAFPIFYQLVTHLGERQDLAVSDQIVIFLSAAVLHGCYWTRLLLMRVTPPFKNRFVAHLLFLPVA